MLNEPPQVEPYPVCFPLSPLSLSYVCFSCRFIDHFLGIRDLSVCPLSSFAGLICAEPVHCASFRMLRDCSVRKIVQKMFLSVIDKYRSVITRVMGYELVTVDTDM